MTERRDTVRMMRNLTPLSDYEFELLVADLLSAETGLHFEAFARGPDGGVDLRATRENGSTIVVQCKHYVGSDFRTLQRAARKEQAKVAALDPPPGEYRFVTSRGLTVRQKSLLAAALKPWITRSDHVIGAQDLEGLLNRHEDVERQHVKLWLASGTALRAMLRAGTVNRSRIVLEQIREALPRYVHSRAFGRAQQLLADTGVCLIAGEPGVGKTTLAQMLLLDSANAGYQPIVISEDIEEGWEMLEERRAQIFYYDDFLGRTSLTAPLGKNEDARLVELITRATRLKDRTRLILTTREYILRGATQLYETFRRADLDHRRFLLTMEDYSRFERALILYNHVRHSDQFEGDALRAMLSTHAYRDVIDHPNYSPRLIEFITGLMGPRRLANAELREWPKFAIGALDHPQEIWEHAFEHDLAPEQQALLLVLTTLPDDARLDDVREAFERYCAASGISLGRNAFVRALKHLEVTFVQLHQELGVTFVRFANPSIEDFLDGLLAGNSQDIRALVRGAAFFEQLQRVWSLGRQFGNVESPSEAVADALRVLQDDFAEALKRTLFVAGVTWTQALDARGSARYTRYTPALEARLGLVQSARTLGATADARLAALLVESGPELVRRWSKAVGAKSAAIRLVARLDEAGFEGARGTLLPALKLWIASSLDDAEDFDRADDLRRAFDDVFSVREWADIQDGFTAWAEETMEYGSPDEDELDQMEQVAEALDVPLGERELEEARERLEREREEQAGDIDVDEARQALADDEDFELELGPDENAEIDSLFGRLGAD